MNASPPPNDDAPPPSDAIRYADAGVSLDAKHAVSGLIRQQVQRTYGPRVVDLPGAFAGMFRLDDSELFDRKYRQPTLVACTDGVGTKVLVAQQAGKLDTIGIDCVAMNVNDLLCLGAEPLIFLDYLAVNKIEPEQLLQIVRGISDGCVEAGCALLGGETADMPAIYDKPGEFDIAGFAVGVIQSGRTVTGKTVAEGDAIIGISSSGLHSNGYSLARKVVFERMGLSLQDEMPGCGASVRDVLLEPTRIYVRGIRAVLRNYTVKRVVRAMAHITGGGLPGNVDRVLPPTLNARIQRDAWPRPPVFDAIAQGGPVPDDEMWSVFNMGIGYVLIVAPSFAKSIMNTLRREGFEPYAIGEVVAGDGSVELV